MIIIKKLLLNIIELVGQIDMDFLWILKTSRLIPESVKLLLAVALYVHDGRCIVYTFAL